MLLLFQVAVHGLEHQRVDGPWIGQARHRPTRSCKPITNHFQRREKLGNNSVHYDLFIQFDTQRNLQHPSGR